MPFIDDILKYKSLSIVGLEKNTGKTECLNYILKNINKDEHNIAVTSIGIDGESIDQVTQTKKPEITIYENMYFVTSEKHYKQKKITSEIIDVTDFNTSLGRLVIAKAKDDGKVMISGPADTSSTKKLINLLSDNYNINLTIVDGALSRLSPSSPAVTEAMILSTGAAVSLNLNSLITQTKFITDLINISSIDSYFYDKLINCTDGIYNVIGYPKDNKDYNTNNNRNNIDITTITKDIDVKKLPIKSLFTIQNNHSDLFKYSNTIYITGVLNDKVLNMAKIQKNIKDIYIIVKDFTKIFVKPETYYSFIKKGGNILVLDKTYLIAVTINPTAPSGYSFDSNTLQTTLHESLNIPVYDVLKQ
ncbi:MAG: hypothetical protein ACOX4D_08165 [Bacteroidales bacterium]